LGPAGGALTQAWIRDCLPLLHEEFKLIRPEYVLCLGAEATKAVCGPGHSVRNMMGRFIEVPIALQDLGEPAVYHTMKVMAITHPAAVLRTPELQPQFDATLNDFVGLVQHSALQNRDSDVMIHPIYKERDLKEVVEQILALPGLKKIGVDAEWEGQPLQTPDRISVRSRSVTMATMLQ
jgi:hypothetical protein